MALKNKWDKVSILLSQKANTNHDQEAIALSIKLMQLDKNIKDDVLKYYLSKCLELYKIAFC